MPRKHRLCLPEVTYHVTSRCIEIRPLMGPDDMKELMISVLNMALEKYTFELASFTLMDTHFHFFIRTVLNGETISSIMQYIKSQFARRYNKMMDRTGPFWNERFRDSIIELSDEPETAFFFKIIDTAYIPVRSKNVVNPRDYMYGSFNCYIDARFVSPVSITLHKYFLKLGNTFCECVKKFLEYEEKYKNHLFPIYS